jgi:hypothetical protein
MKPPKRFDIQKGMPMQISQLSYLGVISQPEHSQYHFRITHEGMTDRLLILSIEKSVFLSKQLLIQEAAGPLLSESFGGSPKRNAFPG